KIGIAFQLADDVIDIASDSSQSGKTPGTDLKEGVPTLVTLQIMQSNRAEDAELKALLSAPMDDATVARVIPQLREHRALSDAKTQLHQLADEAKSLLASLPQSPARGALENLCHAIVERTA
ncbi:MAG: polyprenyl synthetase family protein, partial [Actinobacteria bacterium]|nr:polyprenyl synthetase family protein [Actinomycetota bacterium]